MQYGNKALIQPVSVTRTRRERPTHCHSLNHRPFTTQVTRGGVCRSEEGHWQCQCTKDGIICCPGSTLVPPGAPSCYWQAGLLGEYGCSQLQSGQDAGIPLVLLLQVFDLSRRYGCFLTRDGTAIQVSATRRRISRLLANTQDVSNI